MGVLCLEIVGIPRDTGGASGTGPVLENGKFPFRKAKATQNGNHNLVHV